MPSLRPSIRWGNQIHDATGLNHEDGDGHDNDADQG
jgi:hypothetical protein